MRRRTRVFEAVNAGTGRAILATSTANNVAAIRGVSTGSGRIGVTGVAQNGRDFTAAGSRLLQLTVDHNSAFSGFSHVSGDIFRLGNALTWCSASGTGSTGAFRTIAGAATAGALHPLATPVRCFDSRAGEPPLTGGAAKGPFASGETRTIEIGFYR